MKSLLRRIVAFIAFLGVVLPVVSFIRDVTQFSIGATLTANEYEAAPSQILQASYRRYIVVDISNKGRRELREVKLLLPVDGEYSLTRSGRNISSGSFLSEITVGPMLPRESIRLEIWTNDHLSTRYTRRYFVTHSDGSQRVRITQRVGGGWAWLHSQGIWILYYGFYVIVLVLVVVRASVVSRRRGDDGAEPVPEAAAADDTD